MGRRILGESSTLSPYRLKRATAVKGAQNATGNRSAIAEKTKAARIPIPPPLGMTPSCELRWFALSRTPKVVPQREITHAPTPPRAREPI